MLDPKLARLCRLSSACVAGDWDEVKRLRAEAPPGEPDRTWREALLMLHLFAGVPRAIEAFDLLSRHGGVGYPEPDEILDEPDLPERGDALFDRIYGPRSEAIKDHLAGHHPDLWTWIRGHAYGRVLTRPGMDPASRELVAVAVLASLGLERQLASHARGAVRCGASPQAVLGVLEHLADGVDAHRLQRARHVVERFAVPEDDAPPSQSR